MSFDIFFQPCRFGPEAVEIKDENTGQVYRQLPNERLTNEEVQAVQSTLEEAILGGPTQPGLYHFKARDGGRAEIIGDEIDRGCVVSISGMTPGLAQFLYDLLKAGNWVMLPPIKNFVAITAAPERMTGLPSNFPKTVVCTSPEQLMRLLTEGVLAWQEYRDQVVGESS